MSSPINGSKRQSIGTPCLTNDLSIDPPFSQWLAYKGLLSSPGHLECPTLVANPITDPVVCPDIDERTYAALEELRNVGIRLVVVVLSVAKRSQDIIIAGAEV